MAATHDLPGGWYFYFTKVKPETDFLHRAMTQEIDHPFRNSMSVIIRLWPTRAAVVMGKWWDSDLEEDDALLLALHGRGDAHRVVDDEGHILERFERAA